MVLSLKKTINFNIPRAFKIKNLFRTTINVNIAIAIKLNSFIFSEISYTGNFITKNTFNIPQTIKIKIKKVNFRVNRTV